MTSQNKDKDIVMRVIGAMGLVIMGIIANDVHQMRPDIIQLKTQMIQKTEKDNSQDKEISKMEDMLLPEPIKFKRYEKTLE